MLHKVAVYGTLRKGQRNHYLLEQADYLFDDYIAGTLSNLGGCPAFHIDPTDLDLVKVEVYEVDQTTLYDLDRLEGHPYMYKRIKVKLFNKEIQSYTYLYQDSIHNLPFIRSGDWVKYYGMD